MGVFLDALGEVDGVANGGVIFAQAAAYVPCDRFSGVNANAKMEPPMASGKSSQIAIHLIHES